MVFFPGIQDSNPFSINRNKISFTFSYTGPRSDTCLMCGNCDSSAKFVFDWHLAAVMEVWDYTNILQYNLQLCLNAKTKQTNMQQTARSGVTGVKTVMSKQCKVKRNSLILLLLA